MGHEAQPQLLDLADGQLGAVLSEREHQSTETSYKADTTVPSFHVPCMPVPRKIIVEERKHLPRASFYS